MVYIFLYDLNGDGEKKILLSFFVLFEEGVGFNICMFLYD